MRPRRPGLSLIEAVAAMTLLGGGLLAVAGTALQAMHSLQRAESVQGATLVAMSVLDSLAQLAAPVDGTSRRGRYDLAWRVTTANAASRIQLVILYADGRGLKADTFAAFAGRWPPRLHHVP